MPSYILAWYSYGKGTVSPALLILVSCINVSFKMSLCISGSFGAPALAPIGTMGATARGEPFWRVTGGNAEMIIVGMPISSMLLCTHDAVL